MFVGSCYCCELQRAWWPPPGPGRSEGSPPVWGLQTGRLKPPWHVPPLVAGIHSERPKMVQAPPPPHQPERLSLLSQNSEMRPHGRSSLFPRGSRNRPGIQPPIQVLGRGDWVGACDHTGQLPSFRAAGGGSPLPAWPWPEARQHSILPFRDLPPHSHSQLGLRWALFPGQGSWSPLTLRFWVETI